MSAVHYFRLPAVILVAGVLAGQPAHAQAPPGRLALTVLDAATGQPTPARVEVLDADGTGHVADDALPVGGDGEDRPAPLRDTTGAALARLAKRIENPYTKTVQCYTGGAAVFTLPAGAYTLRVEKGVEYRTFASPVAVRAGETTTVSVPLARWIDLPAQGWFGADDHLHIARPVPELNAHLVRWMQAEDLHVANLLQWGRAARFHNTLQYAFGPDGVHQEGNTILATGQENPRTHFLGHVVIFGGTAPIHIPEPYILYAAFLEEAKRQGAVAGYAHGGTLAATAVGTGVDLPGGLLTFLEVMQFGKGSYGVWYDILNTGFRMTPTAGTDYPYGPSLPGRERFYTRVEGPLTYAAWLEGIRRGRTFVTNGPVVELTVDGRGPGEEVVLPEPRRVRVEARVRFDPARDDVERLEIVECGLVVKIARRESGASEIRIAFDHDVREAGWLAARAAGEKTGEPGSPPSLAHTAPVYVAVAGQPGRAEHPRARALAKAWAARLEDLEERLSDAHVPALAEKKGSDWMDAEEIRRQRPALVEGIKAARAHFERQARGESADE